MSQSKRLNFLVSDEGKFIRKQLEAMEIDDKYNTQSSYSANVALYPDHQMSFSQKHIHYLLTHPKVDCIYYISNLRLMSKVRND